jgi:hypothetical protein
MPGAALTALTALAFAAAPAAMMAMMVMVMVVMFAMAPFAIATLIPAPLPVLAAALTTFAVMPGMRRAIGAIRSAAARGRVRRTLRPGSGRHAGHGESQNQLLQSV